MARKVQNTRKKKYTTGIKSIIMFLICPQMRKNYFLRLIERHILKYLNWLLSTTSSDTF